MRREPNYNDEDWVVANELTSTELFKELGIIGELEDIKGKEIYKGHKVDIPEIYLNKETIKRLKINEDYETTYDLMIDIVYKISLLYNLNELHREEREEGLSDSEDFYGLGLDKIDFEKEASVSAIYGHIYMKYGGVPNKELYQLLLTICVATGIVEVTPR